MEIGSGSGSGSGSGDCNNQQDQDDFFIESILHSYKNNRVCTVCQEPVIDISMRSIAILKCTHVYHLDCIGSAFNFKDAMECPTCRRRERGQWLYATRDHSRARPYALRLERYHAQPELVNNWNEYMGLGRMDPLVRANQPNLQSSNPAHGEDAAVGSLQHNSAQQAQATDAMNNLLSGYVPPPSPSFPIRLSSTEHQNTSSLYDGILDRQELAQVFPDRENADHGTLESSLNIQGNETVQQDFPFNQSHTSFLGASSEFMMRGMLNYSQNNNNNVSWENAPSLPIRQSSPVSAHGSAQARRRIMYQENSVFAPHQFAYRPTRAAFEEGETSSTLSNNFVQDHPASTAGVTSSNSAPRSPPAARPV